MTVMYLPDIEFGVKYVALIEGRIRECFLEAISLDNHSSDNETPDYVLRAAGIREDIRVPFDWQVRSSFNGRLCEYNSILADSYDDYMNDNFHKYYQLDTSDYSSQDILKDLLPGVIIDDRPKLWQWNKETLKPEPVSVNWTMWSFDADGFKTNIPFDKYYPTKEDCMSAHEEELELVTFD